MDKAHPTLLIKDKLVGLREIHPYVFESKNFETLSSAVSEARESYGIKTAPRSNTVYPYKVTEGLPIVFLADADVKNSLGVVLSNLTQELHNMGINVRIRHASSFSPIRDASMWTDIRHLICEPPNEPYAAICLDRNFKLFDYTMIQYSAVIDACDSFLSYAPDIVARWNKVNTVFTYSSYSKKIMSENGIRSLTVMPLGVNGKIYKHTCVPRVFEFPEGATTIFKNFAENNTGERFVFFIGGVMQSRKGYDKAISAYRKAFEGRTDVLLWIHGRLTKWGSDGSGDMKIGGPPMIWTDGLISDESMNFVLNRADCYVSSHRLEGFGLMSLQAMSCGTPCIVTNYSGPQDFANESNALMLEAQEGIAFEKDVIASGVKWATFKEQDLIEKMILISSSEPERKRLSSAGIATAKAYTWRNAAETIIRHIESSGKRVSRRKRNYSPYTDILVPVRNGAKDIDRFLSSLDSVPALKNYRVTICNDGSVDETEEILGKWMMKTKSFDLKILKNNVPIGAPASRNRLFAETEGEFCMLCDCDLEFIQEGWLEKFAQEESLLKGNIIAPMLIGKDGKIASAGGKNDKYGIPCLHKYIGENVDLPEANIPCEVIYAPSAALFFKRSVLDIIGGQWEEYFPATFDDVDWLLKAKLHGIKTWYAPSIKIVHMEGSYRSKTDQDKYYFVNRKKLLEAWPVLGKSP